MKLDVLYLIFVGYFIQVSEEGGGHGKHVHLKIHVPYVIHKHNHKHTVYKKVPVHVGGHEKKHVVIHKHHHNHKHDHGHKHGHKHNHGHKHGHNHKHKHDHKHKHVVPKHHGHHGHHYESAPQIDLYDDKYAVDPVGFDDDGYKSARKSVRSEHYEVEQKTPLATWPEQQHIVRGSYKVQETDPYDITTTSYQAYDSPVGKKLAQALTNFDGFGRINSLQGEDYVEPEGQEQVEADYDNVKEDNGDSGYGEDDVGALNYKNYEDYGDHEQKVEQNTADSNHGTPDDVDESYNYGREQVERYIVRKVYGSGYR